MYLKMSGSYLGFYLETKDNGLFDKSLKVKGWSREKGAVEIVVYERREPCVYTSLSGFLNAQVSTG